MLSTVIDICLGALIVGLTALILVSIFGIIYNMFHE